MKHINYLFLFLPFIISCNSGDVSPADEGHGHDHGAIAILKFEEGMELFAESDQLVEGHNAGIRAHLTYLDGYIPAELGILYARITRGDTKAEWVPLEPARPGIYVGEVIVPPSGPCDFEFLYEEGERSTKFSEVGLKVYAHDEELPAEEEHGSEAIFTKEQAWETEFGLMIIEPSDFAGSIHCSGEVIIPPQSIMKVISPASGRINFLDKDLIEGGFIKEGDVLFSITGTGLSHENINLEYSKARAEYDRSRANFERKEKLLRIGAVSEKEYEEARSVLEQDRARFELLESLPGEGGLIVRSPVSGFISEIIGSDNDYASTGDILLEIFKTENVRVKAYLPSGESGKITSVIDANMKFAGDKLVYTLDELGGRKLSFAHQVEPGSNMIPVFFELSKTDLIAGTFVEMWLKTNLITGQIVIPGSGILEEYGSYFVYVQKEGEAYEKRPVRLGSYDGKNYQVNEGLVAGEVIVTNGATAIKVANSMGSVPVHSH